MKSLLPFLVLVLGACATTSPPAQAPVPTAAEEGVPQAMVEGHRTAGSPFVPLTHSTIERLRHARVSETQAQVKICIDRAGAPMSIAFLRSTGDQGADATIREAIATWRYRPAMVNGSPAPVCFKAGFHYKLQ